MYLAVSGLNCPRDVHYSLLASLVVVCGLSCPVSCRILVPRLGIKPTFPCSGSQIVNHWTTSSFSKRIPKTLGIDKLL